MRKVIAAINMTVDGFCDHTAIDPDAEIHDHYSELLKNGGVVLYGRVTYQLMEYWMTILENPTGIKSMDEFAETIDNIPKIVFSNTLKEVGWTTAKLAKRDIKEEVTALRRQPGKDILVGSRSLIVTLMNMGLVDEFQLCVHPVILGKGLPLLKNISHKQTLTLLNTKTFGSGAIVLYYKPTPLADV